MIKKKNAKNGHIKFNLTIPLQQLNGLETLVIIMVANKYAFLHITRRRFLNEWEAFKKVISRRNFFFSSRRRHTRLVSDWSSDVCSSDLEDGDSQSRPHLDRAHRQRDHERACRWSVGAGWRRYPIRVIQNSEFRMRIWNANVAVGMWNLE